MPTTPTHAVLADQTQLSHTRELLFHQLIEVSAFAEFALILKQLTGLSMALNTADVHRTIIGVPGDMGNLVCRLIRDTSEGARRCEGCDRRQHTQAAVKRQAVLYTCHAGFFDMAIPLTIQGQHVATISSGQILPDPPTDAGYARLRRKLDWLDVPASRLREAYLTAPWMPRDQLQHVMRLLEIFARQLCESTWRIHELETGLEHPGIRKARALVEARFRDADFSLAAAAATAGLAVAHFSHVFHRETGVTFTRYVQARRVAEAKRLLTSTTQRITEIYHTCGFNSLTHFNRVFRASAGCSPSQYRVRMAARDA